MTRFATRFAALFFFFSFLPAPLDVLPFRAGDLLSFLYRLAWHPVLEPLARLTPYPLAPPELSGSGDTIGDWLRQALIIAFALVAAGLWSLERKRTDDRVVRDVTFDLVRLLVMVAMVAYGAVKVFAWQMPPLDDDLLAATFAEASPAGLMWRFMGYSPAYQHFAGVLELAAGALLLSRRTATAGALCAFAAMTNVLALDLCFDVPVKQVALRYWLGAAFLLAPDARSLVRFLVLRQTATLGERLPTYWLTGLGQWVRRLAGPALALAAVVGVITRPLPPLEVTATAMKGVFVPFAQTDATRWVRVYMDGNFLEITSLDGSQVSGTYTTDEAKRVLHLTSSDILPAESELRWEPRGGALQLAGRLAARDVDVLLRPIKPTEGRLMTWGFHWVQDKPSFR